LLIGFNRLFLDRPVRVQGFTRLCKEDCTQSEGQGKDAAICDVEKQMIIRRVLQHYFFWMVDNIKFFAYTALKIASRLT
jgi:hypothetical protein